VKERGHRRTLVGRVISNKKYVRRYSKFMAHDENNACAIGDRVRIVEHRPLSKRKRWKVQATVESAGAASGA
jgi:small subunit ribosomal protein S17